MIAINRRRAQRKTLPYDAEVEYIIFTGTQFITLPIYPNDGTDAIVIEFRRTYNTTQQRLCKIADSSRFSLYINSSNAAAYSYITYDGSTYSTQWNNINNTYNKVGTVKHVWKIDYLNNNGTFDNGTYSFTNNRNKIESANQLQIAQLQSSYSRFRGHIYRIEYYRNGNLIHNFVAVRKDEEGYLYDKIGGGMYGNDGTGTIGYGIDKFTNLSKFTPLNYIENDTFTATSPYIDTGISPYAGKIDMSMTVKWNTVDSSLRQLMGITTGVYWGCDGGTYKSNGVDSGIVPSTTDFETVTMNTYNSSPTRNGNIALFRAYEGSDKQNTNTAYICSCKLAAYQIKVNDVLVRDYVPVQHPAGVVGMFDKVNNRFNFSANGGTFTGG